MNLAAHTSKQSDLTAPGTSRPAELIPIREFNVGNNV